MGTPQVAVEFLELQTATGWGRTLERFAAWCAPRPGDLALDVGCGPGLLPALLMRQGCRTFGIDVDIKMFSQARLHPALTQADALRLPFPAGAFHLVTASNLLFLLPDPLAALQEMRRVLADGGQICLLNPSEHLNQAAAARLAETHGLNGLARQSLLGWAERAETHARWSESDLRLLLSAAGLQLETTVTRMGPGLARLACARAA